MPDTEIPPGQTLLFDADDTLWENYIYFDQAIAGFIEFLDHKSHSPRQVREALDDCERQTIARMGYGLRSFETALMHCFRHLTAAPPNAQEELQIATFAHGVARQPVQLLPGVEPTLRELAQRHTLVLVTKGHPLEQTEKLRRSGLRPLFAHVEVLAEKEPAAYRALAERHGWNANLTWMIGNSPKSDIQAALQAGLHAVHIPHAKTWSLENCELSTPPPPQKFLPLRQFAELAQIF